MVEGYNNVALYENEAIQEAVEYFNRTVDGMIGVRKISDSKKELNKLYYRDCFAGVEYNFMPSNATQFIIRVFVILPGYSGSNQEAYEVEVFQSIRNRTKTVASKVDSHA